MHIKGCDYSLLYRGSFFLLSNLNPNAWIGSKEVLCQSASFFHFFLCLLVPNIFSFSLMTSRSREMTSLIVARWSSAKFQARFMTHTPLLLCNLFVCVSHSFHNSRPYFIVQLVHDLILLINVTLQSITKHPKTWEGRKKQNETCAENSKLSDLEVIKQLIMHSQHSSGHGCTMGYLPFVITNLYSLHQNKCRVLQLFLPLCSELVHAHLPSFFMILELFLAGTIQEIRFSSPASQMCSLFLIPYSLKACTKSSFSPIMRSLFSAQIMEEMHVCTPRRNEHPILLQLRSFCRRSWEKKPWHIHPINIQQETTSSCKGCSQWQPIGIHRKKNNELFDQHNQPLKTP